MICWMTALTVVGLLASIGTAAEQQLGSSADLGKQQPQRLEITLPVQIDYLISLPEGYEQDDKEWPLLIFLHGAGERGSDLQKVTVHGPPKLIREGKSFPFIVASPQCPQGKRWNSLLLSSWLDDLETKYRIDKDRIYLTGLSMGGFGTWQWATDEPERFAAVAPICGGGERYMARDWKGAPVWAFHGAKDPVVPLARSEEVVNALKAKGVDARLTIYPEATHDSWTETYANPELYKWFLQHSRGEASQ
jgi:predicted peptidase